MVYWLRYWIVAMHTLKRAIPILNFKHVSTLFLVWCTLKLIALAKRLCTRRKVAKLGLAAWGMPGVVG